MHCIRTQIAVAALAAALASPGMAQELKAQTLKMANVVPENSWFGRQHKWWVGEVEKRTGDKLKVQIFWLESLVKWKDALPGIQSGVADLAWVSSTYFPSEFPGYLMLDNLPKAKEHLSALDKLCFITCGEYRDLKRAVDAYERSGGKSKPTAASN